MIIKNGKEEGEKNNSGKEKHKGKEGKKKQRTDDMLGQLR